MRQSKAMGVFVGLLAALGLAACGSSYNSGSGSGGGQSNQTASVFTVGTDASLPSVISCQVTVSGITIYNGSTNVSVLSSPQVVDFAQLSGLHQLLDLNAVPTGTYSSATVTIASPVIGYIDTTVNPPVIKTINGTLSTSSVTVPFKNPVVIQNADMDGLRMELDLRKSIQVDGTGNITGQINPVFEMNLLSSDNADVSIDDFHAGVVSVTGSNTFVIQGPAGRQWTVQANGSTMMDDPNIPISSFTTDTTVSVSGVLNRVTKDIDASEVEVISNDHFFLGGLFTSIRPSPGPATAADLYVREEIPAITGISDGDITTITLDGSEIYRIGNINLPLTTLLFNNSMLAPGQRVDVGGKLVTTNGVATLTVHRVVLRRQGQAGNWVLGSTVVQSPNSNNGSFAIDDKWTAGILLPAPLTVMTTNATNFIGLSGLNALTGTTPIPLRVVGFVLVNSVTGKAVLVARAVQELSS